MAFSRKVLIFLYATAFLFICTPNRLIHGASSSPDTLNILLITIDTLRPDHLGCYGYKDIKTPNIDKLAGEGALFTNAYSPVPLTLPSHTTIMTGQYPLQHGIQDNGTFILKDTAITLAEILHKQDYTTGAIIASYVLASDFGLNQGFDLYDDDFNNNNEEPGKRIESYREGEVITKLASKWLKRKRKKKFFLWVHLFDPHTPYKPPAPFDKEYKNPYDGEIAYTDQCVGLLLDKLKSLKLLKKTCIIIVGDHGEGLWEHEEETHGLFIYDTTIKVPFIVYNPTLIPKGMTIDSLTSTIDIMPTILDILNINLQDAPIQGRSLVSLLTGKKKWAKLNFYCESQYSQLNFNWAPLEGIITPDGWKYIHAPKPELYNLQKDPREKDNLFSKMGGKAQFLKKEMENLKQKLTVPFQSQENSQQIALTDKMRERLQSLGYVCSGSAVKKDTKNNTTQTLADPKDKAHILVLIDRAREAEGKGHFDQAIIKYNQALNEDPNNKMALYSLGLAYQKIGKPQEAVEKIKKVIELDPGYFNSRHILGILYDQLAMPQEAIHEYKEAIRINPQFANSYNNLGMVYMKMNNWEAGIEQFNNCLSLFPNSILGSITHANLAGAYIQKGKVEEAIEELQKSISINSNNRDAHIQLADTYFRIGDIKGSISEWKRIVKIWSDDHISCFKLANLFLNINKPDKAKKYLKKCLQIKPDFIDAMILLERISG